MLPSLAEEILLNSNNDAAVARAFSGDLGCCYPFGFQRAVVIKSGRRTISSALIHSEDSQTHPGIPYWAWGDGTMAQQVCVVLSAAGWVIAELSVSRLRRKDCEARHAGANPHVHTIYRIAGRRDVCGSPGEASDGTPTPASARHPQRNDAEGPWHQRQMQSVGRY